MEEKKLHVDKECGDLRDSLREVEKSRTEIKRELSSIRRQVQPTIL